MPYPNTLNLGLTSPAQAHGSRQQAQHARQHSKHASKHAAARVRRPPWGSTLACPCARLQRGWAFVQVAENTQLLVRIHANILKINHQMQHMEVRPGPTLCAGQNGPARRCRLAPTCTTAAGAAAASSGLHACWQCAPPLIDDPSHEGMRRCMRRCRADCHASASAHQRLLSCRHQSLSTGYPIQTLCLRRA